MLNEAIIELYTNSGLLKPEFTIDTTPEKILQNLSATGIKYTWETVKEEKLNSSQSVIEVKVYLPGHILYGRHVYNTETDALNAHLYAIKNAVDLIIYNNKNIEEKEQVQQSAPVTQQNSNPLSQEEILDMVQQQNNKITTAEQFNNDPREQIPFDDVDMDLNELNNLLSGTTSSKTYETEQQPVQQAQQPVSHGFTQSQIAAMNEFKQRLNITNDAMLGNYINSWDNKLSKKEDLNPTNIDSFIEWTHTVGKAPC